MTEKPFITIKGCTLELGVEPPSPFGTILYWERITTPDGRVLRYVSTNADVSGMEDSPIDAMVIAEAAKVASRRK